MDVEELAATIRRAFAIARTGRPEPVLIDIPKDITAAESDFEAMKVDDQVILAKGDNKSRRVIKISEPAESELEAAARMINNSTRPIIYAGGGVKISGAEKELLELAKKAQIPVSQSLMARDTFPADNPLCTWMLGMHGTKASNMAVTQSDLVIAIGACFSDRVYGKTDKFANKAKILHIDIDPSEFGKNIAVDLSLAGDVKNVLTKLLPKIKEGEHKEWLNLIEKWKKEYPSCYDKNPVNSINPKHICECIARVAGPDTFITTEVGQHQMWTAQFYPFKKPRTFITSGGLGTMGFGTGATIGVLCSGKNKRVVHIAGDGSFRMNCNELATISHYKLPLVIVVENNNALGNVRMWQRLFYGKRFSQTTLDFGPDWCKLAKAYGIKGYKARNIKDFEKVFKKAFESGKAAIIDARVDKDEMVLPMVPGGNAIYDMIMELSGDVMD